MERRKVTFAGITFSAIVRDDEHYTVPVNVIRKVLTSGRVHAHRNYHYTDDYAHDAKVNNDKGDVDPSVPLGDLELGKPWLCYFSPKTNSIRFCPMQSLAYTFTEKP